MPHQPHHDSRAAQPRQPVFNAPPAVSRLCLALVAAHVLFRLLDPDWQETILADLAFVPQGFHAIGRTDAVLPGLARLVTHAALHADALHLFLNVGFLLAFGSVVERRLGAVRFLAVFVLGAAAGAVAQALAVGPDPIPMIGASGAVYAMIGAAMPDLFEPGLPRRRGMLVFGIVLMALNLIFGLLGLGALLGGGEIAWQAHIGGFVAGLAVGALRGRGTRR